MKKFIIALAAIAAFTMVSCEKEQLIGPDGSVDAGDCIITAFTENSLTKTSLSGDDSGYNVVWSQGDKISIGDNIFELSEGEGTTMGKFRGTLPKDGQYTAYYPATYNGTDWPASQTYAANNITGSPMKAEVTISGGKVSHPLSFKNAGGILRLTLKGTATVSLITVNVPGSEVSQNTLCLKCGGGVSLDNTNGKVFHIALPEGTSSEPLIQIKTVDGKTIDKRMKSGRELVIERSKITDVSLSGINSTSPAGMLPGMFTVAEGRQVYFSRGNLHYTVASQAWQFYDRQYDCGPSNYEDGHDKDISLFTWGYNAEKSIESSRSDNDNVSVTSGNLNQTDDWGSQIGNGKTWRTLTSAEWQYLFNTRENASQKYGLATVCGIQGLIILPDVFDDPYTNGGSGKFKCQSSTSRWTDNVYTSGGNWEAMEYAGAVFLPAAGRRNGEKIGMMGSSAFYWSSSAFDRYDAYILYFEGSGYFKEYNHHSRGNGCSVRLVTDICTVTFDLNGKPGTAPESIKNITRGSTIQKPSDPTAVDYVFTGWYKDQNCNTLWDFQSDVVTTNTTLYAGWYSVILPARFTVANGKHVYFTKSNVWADGSNALHFENKPYDYSSSYDENHVSHFTWSSSVSDAVGTTGSGDYLFCDENHKVSVNGSEPKYFALSLKDWAHLCTGRLIMYSYSNNITYYGRKGLVLYSDFYVGGDPLDERINYTDANFPPDCVFIPYAGWRDNDAVAHDGAIGFYWTSTADSETNKPYFIDSDEEEEYMSFSMTGDPNNGLAIRLVTYAD